MTEVEVIPGWIYGLNEYEQIFDLKPEDYEKTILDFPGSISSFNADAHLKGAHITSSDAIYRLNIEEMRDYANNLFEMNAAYLKKHANKILKEGDQALDSIFAMWERNKLHFLQDYAAGKRQGRYESVLMPELPYVNHQFQLALCSDYVFCRHAQNSCRPEQVVFELCRVSEELRIFPLLTEKGEISEWLGPVMLELQNNNYGIEIREVSFKNLIGANAMLRVWALECTV